MSCSNSFSLCCEKHIYIFNLCENSEISFRTVNRIYEYAQKISKDINKELIIEAIGNTPTSNTIINSFQTLDLSSLSLFSLFSCGITGSIIEALRDYFSSIQDLASNYELINSLHFQSRTTSKIEKFFSDHISDFNFPIIKDSSEKKTLPQIIIDYLDSSYICDEKPVLPLILFQEISSINCEVTASDFYKALYDLSDSMAIKNTPLGILRIRPSLSEYLDEHANEKHIDILIDYINGKTFDMIAKEHFVSRQRIDQIVDKTIPKLPIFDGEIKAYNLLKEYKLSKEVLKTPEFPDSELIYYVKVKYSPHPTKGELDYVFDNSLENEEIGRFILKLNNRTMLNGQLVKLDFITIFTQYIEDSNVIGFLLDDLIKPFKTYLLERKIELNIDCFSPVELSRKISNSDVFLDCGSHRFLFFNESVLSEQFLQTSHDYIENFYGWANVKCFYDKEKAVCNASMINNEYELFAVLKRLYEKDFYKDVDFLKNPTIRTRGLSKEDFFKDLIDERQPILEKDFINLLVSEYGFSKNTLICNSSNFFNSYQDYQGYLRTNIETLNPNSNEAQMLRELLNNREVLPSKEFELEVSKLFPQKHKFYTSRAVLRELGYRLTNSVIYKTNFSSFFESLLALSENLPIAITEATLIKYIPAELLDSRYSILTKEAIFLKFSYDKYLNVQKRINREYFIKFRDFLVSSLDPKKIYTLDSLLNSREYRRSVEKFPDIRDLFEAMNYKLLISLLKGSDAITNLQNNERVFCTGETISMKRLIKYIVQSAISIDRIELFNILLSEYGIEFDCGTAYFFELGLYYSSITNRVYNSKETCDLELAEYLTAQEAIKNELEKN